MDVGEERLLLVGGNIKLLLVIVQMEDSTLALGVFSSAFLRNSVKRFWMASIYMLTIFLVSSGG